MHSDSAKAVFLDRDGVINRERGGYTWLPEDFILNEGLADALLRLQQAGYLLIVISNQSGIAKGVYSHEHVESLHALLEKELSERGVSINAIYYCPHHPDVSRCICRKPDSGMLERAAARFRVDKSRSWFIGDADRDKEAAIRCGIRPLKVHANDPLGPVVDRILTD